MDRRSCIIKAASLGICPALLFSGYVSCKKANEPSADELENIKSEKAFVENWLSDLLEGMEKTLDRSTQVKLIENCGKACFSRYKFKQDIAEKGKAGLADLIEAYKNNFEVWQEGNVVHVRYGEVSASCYCPAAKFRKPKANDLHCECTRMTHQTIFETALGKPVRVEVVESLRRGGKTCHFAAYV